MNKIIIIVLIVILLAGNIIFGLSYFSAQQHLEKFSKDSQVNSKIANLSTLFIQKVLKTQGEVTPEDRLKLENAVYNTGDSQIISAWQSFTASSTEQDAQLGALNLLSMFSSKIVY